MSVLEADRETFAPLETTVLAVGFLAVAAGLVVARGTPASGYELSIYEQTPLLAWGAFGVGALVALWTVVTPVRGPRRGLGFLLGSLVATSVVALPVVRGYRFLGAGDSLTHLGWTRDMATGALEPAGLLYPALHVVALQISRLAGVDLDRALLLVVVLFAVISVALVPLTVRRLYGDRLATGVGAVFAWLFVPVDNISLFAMPHPATLALFFLPVVLFLLLVYLRSDRPDRRLTATAPGIALALAGASIVLVHPQQATHLLVVLVVVALGQALARRQHPRGAVAGLRPVYGQTALFAAVLVVWTVRRERFRRALVGTANNAFVGSIGASSTISQRGGSLTELGSSVPELYVKLFLIPTVLGLAAAALWYAAMRNRTPLSGWTRGSVVLLGTSVVPLVVLFGLYFIGTPTMAFRVLGFVGVLVTVLGAVGIARALDAASRRVPDGAVSGVAAVVLAAMVVLGALTVFTSPWVYRSTQHVTDERMAGYEAALDHHDPDVPFVGLRTPPGRYVEGIYGVDRAERTDYRPPGSGAVPPDAFADGQLAGAFEGPRYLPITRSQVEQEVGLYGGLRYPESGFEALDAQPRVDRVYANGEFQLYRVDGTADG